MKIGAAHAAEGPGRAVDPARHELFGPIESKLALVVRHSSPIIQHSSLFFPAAGLQGQEWNRSACRADVDGALIDTDVR